MKIKISNPSKYMTPEVQRQLDALGLGDLISKMKYIAPILIVLSVVGGGIGFTLGVFALAIYSLFKMRGTTVSKMNEEKAKYLAAHPANTQTLGFFERFDFGINTILLIASNLLVIVFAVLMHTKLTDILVVYFIQTVILLVLSIVKIVSLRKFTLSAHKTMEVKVLSKLGLNAFWGQIKPNSFYSKLSVAASLIFFGLMSLGVYLLILAIVFRAFVTVDTSFVAISAVIFAANHLFSYFYSQNKNSQKVEFIDRYSDRVMLRIIPLQILFICGGLIISGDAFIALILFCVLKTAVDVWAHLNEHQVDEEVLTPEELQKLNEPVDETVPKEEFFQLLAPLKAFGFFILLCVVIIAIGLSLVPVSNMKTNSISYLGEKTLGECLGDKFISYTSTSGTCNFEIKKDSNLATSAISKYFSSSIGQYLSGMESDSKKYKAQVCFANQNKTLDFNGTTVKNLLGIDQNIAVELYCQTGQSDFIWKGDGNTSCEAKFVCDYPYDACCLVTFR